MRCKIAVSLHRYFLFVVVILASNATCSAGQDVFEFTGVVTLQLLPARVLKINEIIEDPEPGTSYIGDVGILVEVEENPQVIANWSVVTVTYLEYDEPRTIRYDILSEQAEITVKYRAVSIEVTSDLSETIPQ